MNLIPRNLAARMTGVLLLGMVLAQLLSMAINILDRGRAFYRSTTLQVAEHISDIAKALDVVRPEERVRIIRRLSDNRLTIMLSGAPPSADDATERHYARTFEAMLRRDLGTHWPVHVQLRHATKLGAQQTPFFPETPENALDRYLTLRLFYLAPRGFSFVTQIQLHDGSWVTFSARLPYEHIARLYVLLPKLALMLAMAVVLLLIAVRWVTHPMKKMAQAALLLGQDLHHPPLEENGPEEIRATARALNIMQLRLQEYVRDRAAMLAALSHDLKTFITRLRLRTELLPESAHRERLSRDLSDMAAMVGSTLEYLHGIDPGHGRVQFDATALAESIRNDAEDMGENVAVAGAAGETFYGNPPDLRRGRMNLVDNAVKYGGRATIRLEDRSDGLTIAVCDPGPGIPSQERERVFEPFYRSQPTRGRDREGTGLGLNIARTIARAHGGDVILQDDASLGFCAVLRLPRFKSTPDRHPERPPG